MWNRTSIGIIVVIFLLFVDLLIYNYQNENSFNGIMIPCYPSGKVYSQKDMPRKMKRDFPDSNFILTGQRGDTIRFDPVIIK